jgi:hypothetical protein
MRAKLIFVYGFIAVVIALAFLFRSQSAGQPSAGNTPQPVQADTRETQATLTSPLAGARTAELDLAVGNMGEGVGQVRRAIQLAGGTLLEVEQAGAAARIVFAAPATQLDATLANLRGASIMVTREVVGAPPVAPDLSVLFAQASVLEASAAKLREFMNAADNGDQVLSLQRQLLEVEAQLQRIRAQITAIQTQTSTVVITVTLDAEPLPAQPPAPSGDVAWTDLIQFASATIVFGGLVAAVALALFTGRWLALRA